MRPRSTMHFGVALALVTCFVTGSHGFYIDQSCSKYNAMVLKGVQDAFNLAKISTTALRAAEKGGSDAVSKAQLDLVSYMFAEAMSDGKVDPKKKEWNQVQNIFGGVEAFDSNDNGQPKSGNNYKGLKSDEVVIFCTFDHWKKDGNYLRELDWNYRVKINSLVKGCQSWSGLTTSTTDAFTIEFPSQTDENGNDGPNKAAILQLCPPYLDKLAKEAVQTEDNIKSKGLGKFFSKLGKKAAGLIDSMTPMDVAYTFSNLMLHELTHAVPVISTVDSDGFSSYGWSGCSKLSNSGGTKNADSYAYFGLGAWMISGGSGQAQRPMQDGTIQDLPAAASKRTLGHRAQPRASQDPELTFSIDHTRVTMGPSNRTELVIPEPSSHPVTVTHGRDFTIGTDVVSLASSALIIDSSTLSFPDAPGWTASTFQTKTSRSSTKSSKTSSKASSKTSSKTSKTSTEKSSDTSVKTSSRTSSRTSSEASSKTSSKASSQSTSKSSSKRSSKTGSSKTTSTTSVNSRSRSGSRTSTKSSAVTSQSSSSSTTNGAIGTVTESSKTIVAPITVVHVTKGGKTTPVTYFSTFTSSGKIKPTGAWMCSGPLCDPKSTCAVPLFCSSQSGSGASWGLCCGWTPPPPPDGGPPAPGGPSPGPQSPSTKPTKTGDSSESRTRSKTTSKTHTSKTTSKSKTTSTSKSESKSSTTKSRSSTSTSKSRSTKSTSKSRSSTTTTSKSRSITTSRSKSRTSTSKSRSSSSCSEKRTSACDVTTSVVTKSGATTGSTTVVTGKCSTITACSGSINGTTTATTSGQYMEVTPIFDTDNQQQNDAAQSILAALPNMSGKPVTWSGDGNSTTSKTTSSTSKKPSSASKTTSSKSATSKSTKSASSPSSSSASTTSTSTSAAAQSSVILLCPTQREPCDQCPNGSTCSGSGKTVVCECKGCGVVCGSL